ncbi:hypothetical protein HWV62_26118 [Athelia sp. TMB]|nr:hypothetical protein HWV62_26118 [Athelia sp. TMB]
MSMSLHHAELNLREAPPHAADRQIRFNRAPTARISPYFAGREKELARISTSLAHSSNDEPPRFVVYGMPGLGKSQLALQFSKSWFASHDASHEDACVFWISATTMEKLSEGLTRILHLVHDETRDHPDQAVRLMNARRWLEEFPRPWLLILDDATPDVIPFLREHLPRFRVNGCSAILFTTRTCQVAEDIANPNDQNYHILELGTLSVDQSATLLLNKAGRKTSSACLKGDAEKLVKKLGCLPLAVDQAGAYMKRMPTSRLSELLEESALQPVIHWENKLSMYEKRSILATFGMLLQNLSEISADASHLLNVLAFFDPDNIPLDILDQVTRSLWKRFKMLLSDYYHGSARGIRAKTQSVVELFGSKPALQEALNNFEDLSLAHPLSGSGELPPLHIHDLVQLVLINQSTFAGQAEEYHAVAVALLTSAFNVESQTIDLGSPQSWARCERFVPHLISLQNHSPVQILPGVQFMNMCQDIARYFQKRGRFDEAEALLTRVLAQREEASGRDHPDTLTTVHFLARLFMDRMDYVKSATLYKRALAGRKKQLGKDHLDTLMTAHDLAVLHNCRHEFDQAAELLSQVLAEQEWKLGLDHLDTLETAENLAVAYQFQRKYDVARTLFARVLAGREGKLGSEHPDTLTTRCNFGHLYCDQNDYGEAEKQYKKALEGMEEQLGVEHPQTLAVVHAFALLREYQERWEEAEELHIRALTGAEKVLGPSYQGTIICMEKFAEFYEKRGRHHDAETLRARFRPAEESAPAPGSKTLPSPIVDPIVSPSQSVSSSAPTQSAQTSTVDEPMSNTGLKRPSGQKRHRDTSEELCSEPDHKRSRIENLAHCHMPPDAQPELTSRVNICLE